MSSEKGKIMGEPRDIVLTFGHDMTKEQIITALNAVITRLRDHPGTAIEAFDDWSELSNEVVLGPLESVPEKKERTQ